MRQITVKSRTKLTNPERIWQRRERPLSPSERPL
jgi:hypothetical protein